MSLVEAVWRYRVGGIRPEELPMIAAEALAAGLGADSPALCELAGLPRNADSRDIRELFEPAVSECGIEWPDPGPAHRHALRRAAARLLAGELSPAELAYGDERPEEAAETAEEKSFVSLIPPCDCCLEYTVGLDRRTWEAELRAAAVALVESPPVGPGR
ncbi:hypothetical protein GCM10010387_57600 [Streptomyces inusitatus]|uniref:Uncharacterized protein n=1 Tax=Streptomyces inusitatus TaxID=68221 RepID=A0A918V133_9ACTN|nr:hypothetical protein [Streptomyces inusitatus]GGZ55959.1 hypothetical protein GCM10010387_57600 [Streptomyces inusitatus]